MLRIVINDREFLWNSDLPMTAGDLAAAREIGLGLDGIQALFGRLSVAIGRDPAQGRMVEFAELVVQVAYLAAARQDHTLRYRDFAYSVSLADLKSIVIDGADKPATADEEKRADAKLAELTAAAREQAGASLGEALVEAGAATGPEKAPAKRPRKPTAKAPAAAPKRTRKPPTSS